MIRTRAIAASVALLVCSCQAQEPSREDRLEQRVIMLEARANVTESAVANLTFERHLEQAEAERSIEESATKARAPH